MSKAKRQKPKRKKRYAPWRHAIKNESAATCRCGRDVAAGGGIVLDDPESGERVVLCMACAREAARIVRRSEVIRA